MKRSDIILYEFYVKNTENGLSSREFENLNEDDKSVLIDGIVRSLVVRLDDNMESSDTQVIDKTRGEVRRMPKIEVIINALDNLPAALHSIQLPTGLMRDFEDVIKITTKCIHNVYNEVNVFKNAYKGKKILLMIKYQTLINSFISAFFVLSTFVNQLQSDRTYVNKVDFGPIKGHVENMKKFNDDINNGNWKTMVKDTELLRESFVEVDPSVITESSSLNLLIGAGLQALGKKLNIGRLNVDARGILYTLTGVVMLALSVREITYVIQNSRVKFGETLKNAIDFAEIQTGQAGLDSRSVSKKLDGLKKFANKFLADQDEAYKFTSRDIENENKNLVNDEISLLQSRVNEKPQGSEVEDDLGFDFMI